LGLRRAITGEVEAKGAEQAYQICLSEKNYL